MTALPSGWALLVIDMQNDFLDKGGYYARRSVLEERPDWATLLPDRQLKLLDETDPHVPLGSRTEGVERVVGNTCTAISMARKAGRPIAFIRAVYGRSFDVIPPLLANAPDRQHFPCKKDSWGSAFFGAIRNTIEEGSKATERVIEKHTYDAFSAPSLTGFLQEHQVSAAVICGTDTSICVLASAQHAALLGYQTFVVEDAVWSADAATADAALSIFRSAYGQILKTADL